MPKFEFDFSVDAWITNLSIEADSKEEALEKLRSYSLDDIILEGYVKNFELKDIEYTVQEDEWEELEDETEED